MICRFDKPVRVVGNARGNLYRNVTSTVEAAEFLLNNWPRNHDTRKHLAARKACTAKLEGLKEARIARKAFEEAAKEANILSPAQTFGTPALPNMRPRPRRKLLRDVILAALAILIVALGIVGIGREDIEGGPPHSSR